MERTKDGKTWRLGRTADIAWITEGTSEGVTITAAIPPVFDAYATYFPPDDPQISTATHERAVVQELVGHTPDQPWWLGYLETGAHDIVFPDAPRVVVNFGWPYVLVEAGPEQALSWRTGGHIREPDGSLPDLFFPADRSWLVSALWDDTWTCVGGPADLIEALHRNPLVRARRVGLFEDAKPPERERD